MAQADKVFMPSHPLEPGARYGVLSGFDPGTRTLQVGFRLAPAFRALPVDIVLEKDVRVTMRDGVTTYVDVLRPVGTEKVPVIVAWSPYGKGQGSSPAAMGVFGLVGLDNGIVSGLQKFEGPDPAYWCARGYAICNPDVRGVADSEGDSVLWDRQEDRDCHDLIEWLAAQEWCTGKVAMSGTSYLAVAQWFAAAEQPPHLTAINPWEGVSDVYRDLVMRGGMPDTGFARQLQDNSYWGRNRKENILAEAQRYPLVNDLWANKIPRFDRITVPAYVVASYSNTLHTAGTFRAWRRIRSGCASTTARSGRLLRRSEQGGSAPVLRSLPEGAGQRLGADTARPVRPAGPRRRRQGQSMRGSVPPAGRRPHEVLPRRPLAHAWSGAPVAAETAVYDRKPNPGLVSFVVRFDEETTHGRLPESAALG